MFLVCKIFFFAAGAAFVTSSSVTSLFFLFGSLLPGEFRRSLQLELTSWSNICSCFLLLPYIAGKLRIFIPRFSQTQLLILESSGGELFRLPDVSIQKNKMHSEMFS